MWEFVNFILSVRMSGTFIVETLLATQDFYITHYNFEKPQIAKGDCTV